MCRTTRWRQRMRLATGLLLASSAAASGQTRSSYSPAVDRSHPTEVYWGDTHVHTSLSSIDANISGLNDDKPELAYRFARGEVVTAKNGMPVQLRRPLDFLVIADHAEGLGATAALQAADPAFLGTEHGRRLYDDYRAFRREMATVVTDRAESPEERVRRYPYRAEFSIEVEELEEPFRRSVWNRVVELADAFDDPGTFTALAGYEWISGLTFANLHRVVIFKDDASKTGTIAPFSFFDSADPEDLWRFLERYKESTGGDVLAIPHNANLSKGQMFAPNTFDGSPLSAAYAETRSRWEPLYEVTQIKGDSETHPVLSPTDEFADFETWNSWAGEMKNPSEHPCCQDFDAASEGELKKAEYARSALKRGLKVQAELGINPFKFGMIGSTDAHTSLATADNDNFWGKFSINFPSPERMFDLIVARWPAPLNWEGGAAGYAAVWAHENTRASIFEAMKRKEVYATSGPRITVRFFGGWSYRPDDVHRLDFADIGYAKGVPMGGDLSAPPPERAPSFLIRALRDPDGANLDRVQVVKGWRDRRGELHEKVYDVALSDGRRLDADGKAEPLVSTVNVKDASYTNTIGDAELAVTWRDEDFNPDELAFYYVRVLEIPTPRWTAYDAKFFGIENIPEEVRMVTQERVYTSPIWYTPR